MLIRIFVTQWRQNMSRNTLLFIIYIFDKFILNLRVVSEKLAQYWNILHI